MAASGTKVFVAWQERHNDGSYSVQLRVSDDSGATFSLAVPVNGDATVSTVHPKLAYADSRLYLLFEGFLDGVFDVLLRSSTDDGDSFGGIRVWRRRAKLVSDRISTSWCRKRSGLTLAHGIRGRITQKRKHHWLLPVARCFPPE